MTVILKHHTLGYQHLTLNSLAAEGKAGGREAVSVHHAVARDYAWTRIYMERIADDTCESRIADECRY